MKYPQSVPMTRDVEDWLQSELDARGIDADVYTRHILPLLQPVDHTSKCVWSSRFVEGAGLDLWQLWDDEALKRLNVVRCLMSASDQKCDIESLVDELCAKLKDIQSGAACADNAFSKCDYTPPFAADLFDCGLAPSREGLERGGETLQTTGWTRGLLRASLDQSNPGLFYDDTINIEDCFSIMYCGQKKSLGHVGGIFPGYAQEDVKRLYERAVDTGYNDPTPRSQVNPNLYDCFFNPNFFAFRGIGQEPQAQVSWSLGGVIANSHKSTVNNSSNTDKSGPRHPKKIFPAPPPEEEDLLTSARTHFRPIRSEEAARQPPKYADGTTFVISTELDDPPFKRSESGTLFLNNGTYLEYKNDDEGRKDDVTCEFVPKFRMRQSNEKFCQTDDIDESVDCYERVVPASSPDLSESTSDEFYFPGDDELAHGIDSEDLPAEDEIMQIVSGRWNGVKAVVENALLPPDPELVHITELDQAWESDQLVNGGWKKSTTDNQMDGDLSEGFTENPAWPMSTSSIWNTNNTGYSCESCHGQVADNLLVKREWRGIWGPPLCSDCKDSESEKTATAMANKILQTAIANEKVDVATDSFVFGGTEKSGFSTIWSSTTSLSGEEKGAETNDEIDFCRFGPFSSERKRNALNSSDHSGTRDWPRIGAFTAYLEEKRAEAFEMIQKPIWSPVHTSEEEILVRKPRELRGLWSEINGSEDEGGAHALSEWREIWSPIAGLPALNGMNVRAATYSLLRDELSEDGDQLLSDLSCLHLEQVVADETTDASDMPEDDAFPTAPPSPDWDKSSRFTGLAANWHLAWEAIDQDNQTQDERSYNPITAQKERKRRNSSSQKVCELYLEGECRRPHCRFLHCDAAVPCPFFDDASCLKGDACPLSHRDVQRAFTL